MEDKKAPWLKDNLTLEEKLAIYDETHEEWEKKQVENYIAEEFGDDPLAPEDTKITFPLYYDTKLEMFNRQYTFDFAILSLFNDSQVRDAISSHYTFINESKCKKYGYGDYGYYKFSSKEDLLNVLETEYLPY